MKKFILYFSCILFSVFAEPQVWAQDETAAASSAQREAFPAGEKLTYNVSFANFIDAGFVELYAAGREKLGEREVNVIRAKIRTSGVVQATFFNLDDDFTSFLSTQNNLPVRSERFHRLDEKLTEVEHDFAENQTAGESNVYDLLGALYHLRNNVSGVEGAEQTIKIWENEQIYNAKFHFVNRQSVTTMVGAFKAVVVEIRTDDANFNRYKPQIYFSDDERHLPVVIRLKHPRGEIRAELASVQIIPAEQEQLQPETPVQPTPQPAPMASPSSTPARVRPTPRPYVENQLLAEDLPFSLGEKLQYEVLIANLSIGNVSLQVGERKQFFGRDSVMLSAVAQPNSSQGILKPNDRIDSYINPDYLVPFRNEIKLGGNLAQYNQVLTFDQERGQAVSDKAVNTEMPVGTHDVLSFVYALRGFRFDNSKKPTDTRAAIFIGNKPVVITIKPVRETIEIKGKRVAAIALTMLANDPQIDSLGLRLWLSDDLRHVPLRLTFNLQFGAVQANLINY